MAGCCESGGEGGALGPNSFGSEISMFPRHLVLARRQRMTKRELWMRFRKRCAWSASRTWQPAERMRFSSRIWHTQTKRHRRDSVRVPGAGRRGETIEPAKRIGAAPRNCLCWSGWCGHWKVAHLLHITDHVVAPVLVQPDRAQSSDYDGIAAGGVREEKEHSDRRGVAVAHEEMARLEARDRRVVGHHIKNTEDRGARVGRLAHPRENAPALING
eukprot:7390780-Prymnesium_polylepis.4